MTLKKLKDGQQFRLSQRSKIKYTLQIKLKAKDTGYAYITSVESGRTFCKHINTTVFVD